MALVWTIVGIIMLFLGFATVALSLLSQILPGSRLTWSEWLVLGVLIVSLLAGGIAFIVFN